MSEVRNVDITPDLRARLAAVPILSTLDSDTLASGLEQCPLRKVPGATVVIDEGDYDESFYILLEGRCEVRKKQGDIRGTVNQIVRDETMKSRVSKTVASLKAGDFFGEMSCMSPWPRTSSVYTTGPTLLLEVNVDVFEDWMEASDGFREVMEDAYMARGVHTLLRGMDAFSALSKDALSELLEGAAIERFKKGARIVEEGGEGDGFYVIRGGVVSITKLVDGVEKTVSYMRAGSYFGEMALLDGTPRTATVVAGNNTEVIRIDRDRFLSVIGKYPAAAEKIHKTIRERLQAGEAVLGDDSISDAMSFMAGQGILEGSDVLVVNLSKCIYCGNCEDACAASHGVSLISLHGPTHRAFLFPTACRNCDDPTCLLRCPVDSITRDRSGEVKIDDHCIGCGACAINCPYDTITMRPISAEAGEQARVAADFKKPVTRQANKCDLCDEVPTGSQCVRSCPTGAILRMKPKQLVKTILGKARS